MINDMIGRAGIVGAVALGAIATASSSAPAADLSYSPAPMAALLSTTVFTGVTAKEDSWYAYLGGVHALNGDINQEGWLVRAFIGGGEADYSAGGALGNVDVDLFDADAMVGYQIFEGRNRYTGYIGIHYHDTDLSPNDPANSTQGDEIGAKIQLEADSWIGDFWNLGAIASYSTANDAYWARARLGYDWGGGWLIGPEGVLSGDDEYDEQRIGAFISGIPVGPLNASLAVGYADTSRSGNDSIYGSLGLSMQF